jgi:hypothetical protein
MKTKITLMAIIFIAFMTMAAVPASVTFPSNATTTKEISLNPPAGFSFFRIHRQGRNGITSTWGMNGEAGITGYVVQRTYEDPSDPYAYWENACAMPCNGSRSYKWTDENVYPGFISYRIMVILSNNGNMFSAVETIHIVSH